MYGVEITSNVMGGGRLYMDLPGMLYTIAYKGNEGEWSTLVYKIL